MNQARGFETANLIYPDIIYLLGVVNSPSGSYLCMKLKDIFVKS